MSRRLAARGIYRVRLKVYDLRQPDRERVRMTKNASGSVLAAVLVLVVAFLLVRAAAWRAYSRQSDRRAEEHGGRRQSAARELSLFSGAERRHCHRCRQSRR